MVRQTRVIIASTIRAHVCQRHIESIFEWLNIKYTVWNEDLRATCASAPHCIVLLLCMAADMCGAGACVCARLSAMLCCVQ